MSGGVIIKPIQPKLLRELPAWSGIVEDQRLEIDNAQLEAGNFSGINRIQIDGSLLKGVNLSGLQLEQYELTDSVLQKVDGIGLRSSDSHWLRVQASDARMTGADFGSGHFEDCVFRNLKLDEAGFRFATFKRVRFEQCILRKADFSSAKLQHVVFTDCDFNTINFNSAVCSSVNIQNQDLTTLKGVFGLKNATISSEQLIQLAPLLAAELNFQLDDSA